MAMTSEELSTLNIMKKYYDKIYQKEGWLFVNHTYSQYELLRAAVFNLV